MTLPSRAAHVDRTGLFSSTEQSLAMNAFPRHSIARSKSAPALPKLDQNATETSTFCRPGFLNLPHVAGQTSRHDKSSHSNKKKGLQQNEKSTCKLVSIAGRFFSVRPDVKHCTLAELCRCHHIPER